MNTNRTGQHTVPFLAAAVGLGALLLTAGAANADTLHWSGDVDDTATISISGRDVHVNANMKGVRNERRDFRGGGLPARPVRIRLTETNGRGEVRLVQEPNARNNYTAVVRIVDKQAGRDHYRFTLQWEDRGDRDDRGGQDGEWRRGRD